jgi:hypothetical protein
VLTKKDRNTNELLTVIPLTSKYHKYHIDFGNEIQDSIYSKLIKSLESVMKNYYSLDEIFENDKFKKISK